MRDLRDRLDIRARAEVGGGDDVRRCRARVRGELRIDSRQVQPGDGFIAWPGAATDGRRYLAAALAQGAALVLTDQGEYSDNRVLVLPQLAQQLPQLAADLARLADADIPVDVVFNQGKEILGLK